MPASRRESSGSADSVRRPGQADGRLREKACWKVTSTAAMPATSTKVRFSSGIGETGKVALAAALAPAAVNLGNAFAFTGLLSAMAEMLLSNAKVRMRIVDIVMTESDSALTDKTEISIFSFAKLSDC